MKHHKIIAVLVLAIILVIVTLSAYCYPRFFEPLSVFVKDSLWASVLVTVVLVVINVIYVVQTRQTVKEMEKVRKAEFIPHIRAEISWLAPTYLVLKATNFGKGPAINVKAEITFFPSNERRKWEQAIMSPSEFIRIFLPEAQMEKVCEKSERISVEGEYEDLFHQKFSLKETLHAKEFIEQGKQLKQLAEKDLTRIVEGIKDELGSIQRELRDIGREMERRRETETTEGSQDT
jgi:hypothetical protein